VAAILLSVPFWYIIGFRLARFFGINNSLPVRDQEAGWQFVVCFILAVIIVILLAWRVGLMVVAYLYYRWGEIDTKEAKTMAFFAEYPQRWFTDEKDALS